MNEAQQRREARSASLPTTIDELRSHHTCSIERAAIILGIGRSTAYAAARDGTLPTLRLSHRLLVPTTKLLALLGYGDGDHRPD